MAWTMSACPASLTQVGGLSLPLLWEEQQSWRVVSTGVVHGSAVHLALNMWSVWVVVPWAERAWGACRTAAIFLLSSVLGCVASAAWAEAPLVVGASAGIMGVAGALWVARMYGNDRIRERLDLISSRGLGTMLALMVLLGAVVPMIAQAGHLGGLIAGLALGLGFGRGPGAGAVGVGAVLAAIVGAAVVARAPSFRPGYHEFRGYYFLDRGEDRLAAEALELALESKDDPELRNGVAYALAKAGHRLEWAEELVDASLAEDPENPDYLDTKGWILCRRGSAEEGLVLLRSALEFSETAQPEISGHVTECADAAVLPEG